MNEIIYIEPPYPVERKGRGTRVVIGDIDVVLIANDDTQLAKAVGDLYPGASFEVHKVVDLAYSSKPPLLPSPEAIDAQLPLVFKASTKRKANKMLAEARVEPVAAAEDDDL